MSKKRIIILVALVVVVAGGFFVFQQLQAYQKQQVYEQSSDKVADEFIGYLLAQNVKGAMTLYSSDLAAGYSEKYWHEVYFDKFKDYKGQPTLHSKAAVQPASADVPNRYDPRFNQQPTQYDYDFTLNNLTYRLSIVVFRQNNAWKINEVFGDYQ